MTWDLEADFVIVGSGAGSFCAALLVKDQGKYPIILEKQAVVGGSTAFSGGVVWVPGNRLLSEIDPPEAARDYLDATIGDIGRASTPSIRDAYIHEMRRVIHFLENHGMKFEHARMPDYYSGQPGGVDEGRALTCPLFDVNELGAWAPYLARFDGWPQIPIKTSEFSSLSLANRTWRGKLVAAKIAGRMLYQKLTGKDLRGAGNALQGRMLQIALRNDIEIWRQSPVVELIVESGGVAGVVAERDGKRLRIRARDGVLLNSGGFARNKAMRDTYQMSPASVDWTVANPGDTGEAIRMAMDLGASVDQMDTALWAQASYYADGRFAGFHCPTDAGKPHCIIVDANGRRIANEAGSYVEFGYAIYAKGAIPAWAIIESRHRKSYPWGMVLPGAKPPENYMKKADTLGDLAALCKIDAMGLAATVERFNRFVDTGQDEDFGRGEAAYDRAAGDPRHHPNPCLGKLEHGPFFAIELWPADVGTQGGLLVDENARVLRDDGSAISHLYATGNATASFMGRTYSGGGASIGKSIAFSYVAARHALGLTA